MECVGGGELFSRVKKQKCFSEPDAADAMKQILLAVNYLHSQGMVHRDLKLENFLYDTESGNHLKMIDFGFSKFISSDSRMRTRCGTLAYVAPEVLNKSYTSQCDLWSAGVIAFVMLSGCMPFDASGTSEEQMDEIRQGRCQFNPKYWSNISGAAKEFVRLLLDVNPSRRLDAKKALAHRWIIEHNANKMAKVEISVVDAVCSWASAPKLQKAYASMIAWTLANEQQTAVREYFCALDTDHDGLISLTDLREALTSDLLIPHAEAEQMLSVFEDIQIRYSDFLSAMALSGRLTLDEDALQAVFDKFDTDGSGYITCVELDSIIGKTFEGERVQALVQMAYAKDGRIDFQEFATCTQNYHPGTLLKTSAFAPQPETVELREGACREEAAKDVRAIHVAKNQACCILQ
jgi:calcium-dependent protein kinase